MVIYCVHRTVTTSGLYPERNSSYHHSEAEAAAAFKEAKTHVGDDPSLIEIVRLDFTTLEDTVISSWDGTIDDIICEAEELDLWSGAIGP